MDVLVCDLGAVNVCGRAVGGARHNDSFHVAVRPACHHGGCEFGWVPGAAAPWPRRATQGTVTIAGENMVEALPSPSRRKAVSSSADGGANRRHSSSVEAPFP